MVSLSLYQPVHVLVFLPKYLYNSWFIRTNLWELSSQKTSLQDTKTYMGTSRWVIDGFKCSVQGDKATMKLAWRGLVPDHQIRSSSKSAYYHLMGRTGRISSRLSPRWSTLSAKDNPRTLERPLHGSRPGMSSSSGRCSTRGLKERTEIRES